MNRIIHLLIYFITAHSSLISQPQEIETQVRPLEQFVGYYDVGTKPNNPFFKSRWYLREGQLYVIYDSDIDRKFVPYENGQLSYNVFYNEDDLPEIAKNDTTYYAVLKFKDHRLDQFKIIRPRSHWQTDLYGYRNTQLDLFAVDPETHMTLVHETANFKYIFSKQDESFVREFSDKIESIRSQLLEDFNLQGLPLTTYKIYPDLNTYHNGVLTPKAPEWQKGKVWTEDEIKLVSPYYLESEKGEDISNDLLIHEYIHVLHWNKMGDPNTIPKWLWEGLALYKGCCEWGNPKELEYLLTGDFPSLKEINRNSELQYEIGYYLIEFIVERWSWNRVINLIETNGDIKKSLGISVKKFEEQFYRYLETEYLN